MELKHRTAILWDGHYLHGCCCISYMVIIGFTLPPVIFNITMWFLLLFQLWWRDARAQGGGQVAPPLIKPAIRNNKWLQGDCLQTSQMHARGTRWLLGEAVPRTQHRYTSTLVDLLSVPAAENKQMNTHTQTHRDQLTHRHRQSDRLTKRHISHYQTINKQLQTTFSYTHLLATRRDISIFQCAHSANSLQITQLNISTTAVLTSLVAHRTK